MTETRVTNEKTGGEKGSKPQAMALLPWESLLQVSEVYGFGAQKYAPNNWRKGYDWSLSFSALQRHLAAFWTGEGEDPESGLSHLAHAGFHILTLLVFVSDERYAEMDDRPVTPAAPATDALDQASARTAYLSTLREVVALYGDGQVTLGEAFSRIDQARKTCEERTR